MTSTLSVPNPKKAASPMPVWVILLVFLAGISLGIVVFAAVWMIWAKPQPQQTNQPPAVKVSDLIPDTKPATTTLPGEEVTSTNTVPPDYFNGEYRTGDFVIDETKADLNVRWTKIEKVDPDKVFQNVKVASGTGNVTSFTKFIADLRPGDPNPIEPLYRRGTIVGGAYDGWGLYYWQRDLQGMCMGNCVINNQYIVSKDGTDARMLGVSKDALTYYQEGGLYDWDMQVEVAPYIVLNVTASSFPEKITLPNGKTIYSSESSGETNAACGIEGCAGQTPDLTVGNRFFYTTGAGGCLFTYDEFGLPHAYESVILPLAKDQTLGEIDGSGIAWMKGYESTVKYYRPYVVGGCGFHGCADIVDDATVGTESSLVKVGTTKSGDALYAPKDMANNDMVKKAYETWVDYSDNKSKGSMQDFLNTYKVPVFFWRDAIGRWVKYTYADGVFQGECGKPVIYLYPTKTTAVSVRLPSFIDVTVSEPTYPSMGWKTIAQPNGQLTMADGSTYGSLYWEGLGVNYQTPKDGFLVKDGEQEKFLSGILPKYGLNATESKEFMDFWLPEMTGAPYYRVSFLTEDWSKAAPLYVNPKPDTSIRIFMDWQKLSAPRTLIAPTIVTPERKGFTLVEWGGLLYR